MKLSLTFNRCKPDSKRKLKFLHHARSLLAAVGIVIVFFVFSATNAQVPAQDVYPQGKEFPLVLYSIHEAEEMQKVRQSGWNIAQTYDFKPSFLDTVAEGKMLSLASLPGKRKPLPEDQVANAIAAVANNTQVAWWEFPEEQRHWREEEMAIVTNYAKWTRQYDPQKRPNYMYIPGHYGAEDVQKYVPYLDIIPASVYTKYMHMPHSWVRWRMETTLKGIELAQAKIGPDYLNGEKTPVAVLELFHEPGDKVITPEGAYHDFWQSIVSGARGILVYSYFNKRNHPNLERVWQTYNKAAAEITGSEQLGSAILYGKRPNNVNFEIVSGPARTEEFMSYGMKQPLSYPSIDLLTIDWNKHTYIFAVNSANQPVSTKLTGLPNTTEATVLFENRKVPVSNGVLNTSFKPLGVHIFKVPNNTSDTQALKEKKQTICQLLQSRIF